MEVISICLSDIPKELIKVGRNGKKYISLVVAQRQEPDQYDQDLYVYINQSKEERELKTPRIYLGNGKTYTFGKKVTAEDVGNMPYSDDDDRHDDLPF